MHRLKTFCLVLTLLGLWLESPGIAVAANPDGVAIIIGNRVYEDPDIPNVDFAYRDADAIALFARDVLGLRPENILLIKDASQAQMESAFGRQGNHRGKAFQFVKPGVSDLYVFYSGHGVPGRNDGHSYLLPIDADLQTVDINGYPLNVLYDNLAKVEARSVTVFIDACFSGYSHAGALIKGASGAQILPAPPQLNGPLTVLTAASSDQLASWDEDAKHGLFTEYLLRALYGEADQSTSGNHDGKVSVAEVESYLDDEMRYKARRSYNRDQVPTVNGPKDRILVASVNGSFAPRPELDDGESAKNPPTAPELAIPAKTTAPLSLEPIEVEMIALKNANVRSSPDVAAPRVTTLAQNSSVHVAGKVKGAPWYLVERDGQMLGYVFEPLLGSAEQAALTPSESPSEIDALNERLARLEERRLPPPPPQNIDQESPPIRPNFNGSNPERIERLLKSMAGILAKQNYRTQVKVDVPCPQGQGRNCPQEAISRLDYKWVKIDAPSCSLSASLSFEHDKQIYRNAQRDSFSIHDRRVDSDFSRKLERSRKDLQIKGPDGALLREIKLFRLNDFVFSNREDMRSFNDSARRLSNLCSGAPDSSPESNRIGTHTPPPPPQGDPRYPDYTVGTFAPRNDAPPPPRFPFPPPR